MNTKDLVMRLRKGPHVSKSDEVLQEFAAKAIEELDKRVAELTADNESYRDAFIRDKALSDAIEQLEAYKKIAVDSATECNALRADRDSHQRACLASLKRENKLRAALELCDCDPRDYDQIKEALST